MVALCERDRARILELRLRGLNNRQIAQQIPCDITTVRRWILRVLPDAASHAHGRSNQRMRAAHRLRKAGATFEQIADRCGYSCAGAARRAVREYRARGGV